MGPATQEIWALTVRGLIGICTHVLALTGLFQRMFTGGLRFTVRSTKALQ